MRRLHVISHPEHEMGGEIYYREQDFSHDPELHRAFMCGVKEGWRRAMHEAEYGGYNERHTPRHLLPPMMREHEHEHDYGYPDEDPEEIVYRRHRSARTGRYIR